ncbi:MAG: ABC transporter ATP-binding protein [Candidatus Kryptonium sp.]|nr:ABC transporter ATP-binding protein [Candidatus Kryptonium sp.]MCX7762586.1 ABC transporter ATP-binding protein [Candidatus Kryptonium sp.]MDW8109615.1 ABC transporter ATP-binding protein [Candidatus Kryptonium sp.]
MEKLDSSFEHALIEIQGISKSFGDVKVLNNIWLSINKGEFFSLLGPSGCGKTTLLRIIAGFEKPDVGKIVIDGVDYTSTPPYKRPVNMVFQNYALFPHLNVFENVAFGLRYQNIGKYEIKQRVLEALELVKMSGFEKRKPSELSGGQKQRVALARALVLRPKVLLLDEPLNALDPKLRKEMQIELKKLQHEVGITFIFVTHDQEEALSISDRIAVINSGKIEQIGTGYEIFEKPRTEFVANFMGAKNLFIGVLHKLSRNVFEIELPNLAKFKIAFNRDLKPNGNEFKFIVRPEKIFIRRTPIKNHAFVSIPAVVESKLYYGASTSWVLKANGFLIFVDEQNKNSGFKAEFHPGEKVYAVWDKRNIVFLESV